MLVGVEIFTHGIGTVGYRVSLSTFQALPLCFLEDFLYILEELPDHR